MSDSTRKKIGLYVCASAATALAVLIHHQSLSTRSPAGNSPDTAFVPTDEYHAKIQPILDKRCVVCHSCYNAPCQLNLTGFEGVDRGASQGLVYEANRLKQIQPTRLFEDASSTQEWRGLGFHSVTGAQNGNLMLGLLHQKKIDPKATGPFAAEESHSCPKNSAELADYLTKNPFGGMPYGFPQLDDSEFATLTDWLGRGAPGPDAATLARLQRPSRPAGEEVLLRWEAFLNQKDAKSRIVARYLFEHLFLAHIRFDEVPGDFFRLVRSRTPSPEPVEELATRRPYDSPGKDFYYRFRRISNTIVRKTHENYRLSDAKMARFKKLFFEPTWAREAPPFPSYDVKVASNPFIAFKDIPARARYQFLLDDAFYHVMTFIRGPVCKGNVALNVIDSHFYILFLRPGADPTILDPSFLDQAAQYLSLPARSTGKLGAITIYKYDQLKYLKARRKLYHRLAPRGRRLEDIWDGDQTNDNAVLTVYRHFDSADVIKGAVGGTPKTAWVLDYPIFERIYYDLVAGFDVYGDLDHQVGTRVYMDNLRVESEDNFLSFLPSARRKTARNAWYRGRITDLNVKVVMNLLDPLYDQDIESQIEYQDPKHAKEEFLAKVLDERLVPAVRGQFDAINTHGPALSEGSATSNIHSQEDLEREFAKVTKTNGDFTQLLPDASLIRVGISGGDGLTYTLIHNKAFLNVRFMFTGDYYREPAADDLHILRGVQTSHPNFFFDVPSEHIGDFLNSMMELEDGESFTAFVSKFGVRRLNPRFWALSDWFNERYRADEPLEAGILDLSRYQNY